MSPCIDSLTLKLVFIETIRSRVLDNDVIMSGLAEN